MLKKIYIVFFLSCKDFLWDESLKELLRFFPCSISEFNSKYSELFSNESAIF